MSEINFRPLVAGNTRRGRSRSLTGVMDWLKLKSKQANQNIVWLDQSATRHTAMQVSRSARLARVADRQAARLCAKDVLVVACVTPRLLHCIVDGRVHVQRSYTCVMHCLSCRPSSRRPPPSWPSRSWKVAHLIVIVHCTHGSVDALLVATATGHIWSVAKPTASANRHSLCTVALARAPEYAILDGACEQLIDESSMAQDLLTDEPLGEKHQRSSASPTVAPIACLPGVLSLCAIDASTFAATSNIFPTTVFSSPHAPVELEELEGDQSTCLVALPATRLSRWLLARMKAPETTQHVLLQGDRDGSVRFAVLSAARAVLCTGTLHEASSAIQGIVVMSAGLAIADASGNTSLLTQPSTISSKGHAIQGIVCVPGCSALVYCTLDGALVARAVKNDVLHPLIALPLPPVVLESY